MSNWRTTVRTIIALAIGVCGLCSEVFGQPWDGNGVEGDPYQIWTPNDMQAIRADCGNVFRAIFGGGEGIL
jgi:hypothetical protein